jgi:hypothetical protein
LPSRSGLKVAQKKEHVALRGVEMQEFAGGLAGIISWRPLRSFRGTAHPCQRALTQIKAPAGALHILSR